MLFIMLSLWLNTIVLCLLAFWCSGLGTYAALCCDSAFLALCFDSNCTGVADVLLFADISTSTNASSAGLQLSSTSGLYTNKASHNAVRDGDLIPWRMTVRRLISSSVLRLLLLSQLSLSLDIIILSSPELFKLKSTRLVLARLQDATASDVAADWMPVFFSSF